MNPFEDLYEARMMFDQRRQPKRGIDLQSFHAHLSSFGIYSHPYQMLHGHEASFVPRSKGFRSEPSPSSEYLYRLMSLKRLLDRNEIERKWTLHRDELFAEARQEHARRKGRPIPLGWLADGVLRGLRGIDFWTDLDLREGDKTRNAYRIGLPSDWHPSSDPIVLLCPRHFMSDNARVPTVLDGFSSGPFFATADRSTPTGGHALDLNDPDDLKLGASEFVVPEIPVEKLFFVPLDWRPDSSTEHQFLANSPLVPKLTRFFRIGGT